MKKINICLVAFLFLITTSCDDFLDINTSPNEPADVPVDLVFPAATGSAAYVIGGWYQILGGMWAQHWTQSVGASQYRGIDSYDIQTDFLDDRQFGELYTGALNDLEYIRKTASAEGNWNYYLMATVVQSYTYQLLVDLFDKVPYRDALKGDQGVLLPTYDDGELIYDSLISKLDYALERDFNAITNQKPGADDVIFQGNMARWIQFANTLKLKIYLRQVNARPTIAENGIEALLAENNFLTVDAAFGAFKDEVDSRNPVYETGVDRLGGNISVSRTLFSFLNENGDPRLNSIIKYPANSTTTHNTLVQGDYLATSPTNIQGLSTPNLKPLDAVYFMSASESLFLQAEAQARFGTPGADQDLYEAAIDASFIKFGTPIAAGTPADVYGEDAPGEYPAGGSLQDKIEAIITQKWVALANSQSLEAFLEQNRTGYPDFFTVAVNNVTSNEFPRRLFYPQSERSRNPKNVPSIKPLTEPVWWVVE